jgi:hypothetical protein
MFIRVRVAVGACWYISPLLNAAGAVTHPAGARVASARAQFQCIVHFLMLPDACCLCMLLVACRWTRLAQPALSTAVTTAWFNLMRPAQAWSRCVFCSLHSINFMSMLVLAGTFLVQRRWCCYCTRCVRMFVYIRFTPLSRCCLHRLPLCMWFASS